MKLTVIDAKETDSIPFSQMEIGKLYQVCEGEQYEGAVVVRLYGERATAVGNFNRCWSNIEENTIKVRPLPKGTQVVLIQE